MNEFVTRTIISIEQAVNALRERASRAERGQGTVEYAVILAFIVLVVVAALKFVGPAVAATFNNVTNTLNSGGTATPTPGP